MLCFTVFFKRFWFAIINLVMLSLGLLGKFWGCMGTTWGGLRPSWAGFSFFGTVLGLLGGDLEPFGSGLVAS